jgi:hypothetical protein
MNDFIFLYRGGKRPDSPAQGQQMMQKWMDWLKDLGAKGHIKDPGHPLEETGKVVKSRTGAITDGPYAESKDLVGGYSVVLAKDLAQAVDLSKGCPIFEAGGLVEVRPIMMM